MTRASPTPEIVVYENAFHGRSIATLSRHRQPQDPAPASSRWCPGSSACRCNDIEALKRATEGNPNVVAVLLEPIQGEGGIHRDDASNYLRQLRQLCDERDWLLMLDEVPVRHGPYRQVVCPPVGRHPARRDEPGQGPGLGRADRRAWWRAPRPPTCCSRATTAPPSAATRWPCARVVETIRIMEEERLLENAAAVGDHLKPGLQQRAWAAMPA